MTFYKHFLFCLVSGHALASASAPGSRIGIGSKLGSTASRVTSPKPQPLSLGSQQASRAAALGSVRSGSGRVASQVATPKLGSVAAGSRAVERVAASAVTKPEAPPPGYRARISTQNPTALVILKDESGSMGSGWGTTGRSKADAVAEAVNRMLNELVTSCLRGGIVKNWVDVAIVGAGDLGAHPGLVDVNEARKWSFITGGGMANNSGLRLPLGPFQAYLTNAPTSRNLLSMTELADAATTVNDNPQWVYISCSS